MECGFILSGVTGPGGLTILSWLSFTSDTLDSALLLRNVLSAASSFSAGEPEHCYEASVGLRDVSPSKQSFLLALQTRQEHTSMIRLRASTQAAVMAEVRGTGAETSYQWVIM